MDLKQLFELNYWLTPNPGLISTTTAILFAVFFGLFIALKFVGKAIYVTKKKEISGPERKLIRMLESMLLTMGFFGLLWLVFSFESLPLLSGRFWILIWIASLVAWLYFIARYAFVEMPEVLQKIRDREHLEKYLPKKQ